MEILDIKDYFQEIITAEDVKKGKPDPEIFLKAAEKIYLRPEECVVIEDAVNGIQAAKKGNMKAIALLTDSHTKKDFYEADLIIKSLDELKDKLKN